MADKSEVEKRKPNFFVRIGLFIKQTILQLRKVVTPHRRELFYWCVAVFIFVLILMICVTALNYGLGKLAFLVFG